MVVMYGGVLVEAQLVELVSMGCAVAVGLVLERMVVLVGRALVSKVVQQALLLKVVEQITLIEAFPV
jgi:hypothetical protein